MHNPLIIILFGVDKTMKMEKLKKFHKELTNLIDESLPRWVGSQILDSIPKEYNREDENAQYVYMTRLYTEGEYKSVLMLYDKKYESRIHQKGVKEELLFSYRPITPGVLKDHRIRNERGLFVHTTEEMKPSKIAPKQSNVFVIKKTMWDSNLYDGFRYEYTIYGYREDPKFINEKQIESNAILENLKNQLNIKSLDESEAAISEQANC